MNATHAKIFGIVGLAFSLVWSATSTATPGSDSPVNVVATQDLRLKVGEPFLRARLRIIKLGWKPIPLHQNDGYEYSGTDRILAERNILEVDGCSTDAGTLCIFFYSKLGECLRIDTIGESIGEITITRWTNECPLTDQ